MNWRDLERELLALGGRAYTARRTGERVWSHPLLDWRVRFNLRRKDATRHAELFVRRARQTVDAVSALAPDILQKS